MDMLCSRGDGADARGDGTDARGDGADARGDGTDARGDGTGTQYADNDNIYFDSSALGHAPSSSTYMMGVSGFKSHVREMVAQRQEFKQQLSELLLTEMPSALYDTLPSSMAEALPATLANELPVTLANELPAALAAALPAALAAALPAALAAALPAALAAALTPELVTAVIKDSSARRARRDLASRQKELDKQREDLTTQFELGLQVLKAQSEEGKATLYENLNREVSLHKFKVDALVRDNGRMQDIIGAKGGWYCPYCLSRLKTQSAILEHIRTSCPKAVAVRMPCGHKGP
jgi:hypothetical protein